MGNTKFTASTLEANQTYRVTTAFRDYDGALHPVDEMWRFIAKHFLPYEDGLTLEISNDGQIQWIRLQWRAETQAHIIDNFSNYVEKV